MKTTWLLTAATAVGMALTTSAHSQQITAEEFVATAASSDMFEISSSELAKEKSDTAAVTEFADMMITDHTKSSTELKAAAESAGISVPAEMAQKQTSQLQQLEALSDDAFDAAYIDAQVLAHQEALALMEGYAENGDEEALKAHAAKTAPVIQQHYEHAQQLDSGSQ